MCKFFYNMGITTVVSAYDDYVLYSLQAQGKKPLLVGEFGLQPLATATCFLDQCVKLMNDDDSKGLIGVMLWSLRFRSEEGGFYWHSECDEFYAYHWPGFPSGSRYDEAPMLEVLRKAAAQVQGLSSPLPLPIPLPPTILSVSRYGCITWRGSTSARSYEVHRAYSIDGPWSIIKSGGWVAIIERFIL